MTDVIAENIAPESSVASPLARAPKGRVSTPMALHPHSDLVAPRGDVERQPIDKSLLAIPEVKRLRDKDHLRFVASQPCIICGRHPVEAHHLKFSQPRALGRKVSDAFTVPLCALHHRDLHTTGNELAWWERKKINPLPTARNLWAESHGWSPDEGEVETNSGSTKSNGINAVVSQISFAIGWLFSQIAEFWTINGIS